MTTLSHGAVVAFVHILALVHDDSTCGQVFALLEKVAARAAATSTAEVHYSIERGGSSGPDDVQHFTWRYANGDRWLTKRGNSAGVTVPRLDGHEFSTMPLDLLFQARHRTQCWERQLPYDWKITLHRNDERRLPPDLRTASFSAFGDARDPHAALLDLAGQTPPECRDYGTDGDQRVIALLRGNVESRYWIDEKRGHLVTRREMYKDGELVWTQVNRWKNWSGTWFVREIVWYSGAESPEKQGQRLVIDRARVNEPGLPQSFSVTDIGVDESTNIDVIDHRAGGARRAGFWDSQNQEVLCSDGEPEKYVEYLVRRSIQAQGLSGSAAERERQRLRVLARKTYFVEPTQWQQYTLDFCATHAVTDEQREKALAICADCEEQARRILDNNKEELNRLREEMAANSDIRDAKQLYRLRAAAKRRDELTAGIPSLYYDELKPRLERLLTRAQRKAAGLKTERKDGESAAVSAATQPAGE